MLAESANDAQAMISEGANRILLTGLHKNLPKSIWTAGISNTPAKPK